MSSRRAVTSLETVHEHTPSSGSPGGSKDYNRSKGRSVSVDPSLWMRKPSSGKAAAKRTHTHADEDALGSPSKRKCAGIAKSEIKPAPPGVKPPAITRPQPKRPVPSVLMTQQHGTVDSEAEDEAHSSVRDEDGLNSSLSCEIEGSEYDNWAHASPHSQIIEHFRGFTVASPAAQRNGLGVSAGGGVGRGRHLMDCDDESDEMAGGGRSSAGGVAPGIMPASKRANAHTHNLASSSNPRSQLFQGGGGGGGGSKYQCDANVASPGPDSRLGYSQGIARSTRSQLSSSSVTVSDGLVRVAAVTWNLAGKLPAPQISQIVPEGEFDVYVIGTQECMVSCGTVMSFIRPSKSKWERRMQAVLGPGFTKLESTAMNALHLAVFVRKEVLPKVSRLRAEAVPTGFLGMVGNKGGLAIKFTLLGSSFCFVNAHLSAHQGKVEERNRDWRRIEKALGKTLQSPQHRAPLVSKTTETIEKILLATPHGAGLGAGAGGGKVRGTRRSRRVMDGGAQASEPPATQEGEDSVGVADFVVWLGDLNYRIDMARSEVTEAIERGGIDELVTRDQLRKAQLEGKVAKGYSEGKLNFAPTYKFDPSSDVYDTSKKARVPAWTDRILFKARRDRELSLISYKACESVKSSDHRPVAAIFEAHVPDTAQASFVRQVSNQSAP